MKNIIDVERSIIIKKHLLCKYPWDIFFFEPEKTSILTKIANNDRTLNRFLDFYSPCTVNEAYQIQDKLTDLNGSKGKKLINSGTIDKYISYWGNKKTRYIKQQYQCPMISDSDLSIISKRRLSQSNSKKIIVANMTEEIEAFFDSHGGYLAGKSTVIALGDKKFLKLILALLNSKLISLWYKSANHSTKMAGEALSITGERLGCIPCPNLSSPSLEVINGNIIKFVDKIILLISNNPEADISNIKHQIDYLVYYLYNLTYEEVKIIEPDFPFNKEEYKNIDRKMNATWTF
jgi:hypothetical protein